MGEGSCSGVRCSGGGDLVKGFVYSAQEVTRMGSLPCLFIPLTKSCRSPSTFSCDRLRLGIDTHMEIVRIIVSAAASPGIFKRRMQKCTRIWLCLIKRKSRGVT